MAHVLVKERVQRLFVAIPLPDDHFFPHTILGRIKQPDKAPLKNFTGQYGEATTAASRVES